MNIFVLDTSPVRAAQAQCDVHVVKMPSEAVQLLSTACHLHSVKISFKPTHHNHPCAKWARASWGNFVWLVKHADALCAEYKHRYRRVHEARIVLFEVESAMKALKPRFKVKDRTPFVQAMPEAFRREDAVEAYRTYYLAAKTFARWRHTRKPPSWWVEPSMSQRNQPRLRGLNDL